MRKKNIYLLQRSEILGAHPTERVEFVQLRLGPVKLQRERGRPTGGSNPLRHIRDVDHDGCRVQIRLPAVDVGVGGGEAVVEAVLLLARQIHRGMKGLPEPVHFPLENMEVRDDEHPCADSRVGQVGKPRVQVEESDVFLLGQVGKRFQVVRGPVELEAECVCNVTKEFHAGGLRREEKLGKRLAVCEAEDGVEDVAVSSESREQRVFTLPNPLNYIQNKFDPLFSQHFVVALTWERAADTSPFRS
jgi:hypothetical protein